MFPQGYEPGPSFKGKRRLCVSRKTFTIPSSARKSSCDIPLSNLRGDTSSTYTGAKRTGAARGSKFQESFQNESFRNSSDSEFSPWSVTLGVSLEEESNLNTHLGSSREDGYHRRLSTASIDGPGVSEKITVNDIKVPNPRHKPPSKAVELIVRVMTGGRSDGTALGLTGKPLLYAGFPCDLWTQPGLHRLQLFHERLR